MQNTSFAILLSTLLVPTFCCADGESLASLVQQLNDSDSAVCVDAVNQIGSLTPVPKVLVPLLAHRLSLAEDDDSSIRNRAIIETLCRLGTQAKPAVPKLVAWCGEKGRNAWQPGFNALRLICPEHRPLIDAIGRSNVLHQGSLLLLAEVEPETASAAKVLADCLDHPNHIVRLATCRALSDLRVQAREYEQSIISLIDDDHPDVRVEAISLLAKFDQSRPAEPPKPYPGYLVPQILWRPTKMATPKIEAVLKDDLLRVRVTAAHALRNCDPAIQTKLVPPLIEGLQHRAFRRRAIEALNQLGQQGKNAVPALREQILAKTEDPQHARMKSDAAIALCRIATAEQAVPIYREAVELNSVYRGTIYKCLAFCGSNPQAVDILIEAATGPRHDPPHESGSVHEAIFALGSLRPVNRRATEALIQVAKGSNLDFRWTAIEALSEIGNNDERVLPTLVDLITLPDHDGQHRDKAAQAISRLEMNDAAVQRLTKLLKHEDAQVRGCSALALRPAGQLAAPAVADLIELLDDKVEPVVDQAHMTLSELGPVAEPAVPTLIARMSGDRKGRLPACAASTLAEIGQVAIPALIELLDSDNDEKQIEAVRILENIGSKAAQAVPKLAAMRNELTPKRGYLRDPFAERTLRDFIVSALVSIGKPSVETFIADLMSAHHERRLEAINSLGKIGPDAREAIMSLVPLLGENDRKIRFFTARAMLAIGDRSAATLPVIREMFESGFKLEAIRSLPAIAAADRSGWVRHTLKESIESERESIRFAAARALVEIGGADAKTALPVLYEMISCNRLEWNQHAAVLLVKLLG